MILKEERERSGDSFKSKLNFTIKEKEAMLTLERNLYDVK